MVKSKRLASIGKIIKNKDIIITWAYDTLTLKAVKRFQARHGLAPDGVIGIGTLRALNTTKTNELNKYLPI